MSHRIELRMRRRSLLHGGVDVPRDASPAFTE